MTAGEGFALTMAAVTLGGIGAGLLAHRAAGWAFLTLIPLFAVSLFFPDPPTPGYERLHWFPVTLFALMVGWPLIGLGALLGYGTRAALRWLRHRRDGGMVE